MRSQTMAFLFLASLQVTAISQDERPNFVIILCDNLGYGDLGCYHGRERGLTPRIDEMAQQGLRFTDAYAAAPVCTPSRAALLTGSYPRRVGLDLVPTQGAVLRPGSPYGLNPSEITLAEVLKSIGYATICIGKWHLGDQPDFLPLRQGFDEYFGIPYSDDMTGSPKRNYPTMPWLDGEEVIAANDDLSQFTKQGTERAIEFMSKHRNHPFFLYFPQITPGSTIRPPISPEFRGKSNRDLWDDSITELDWSTGQILNALDKLGIRQRTLVILTSDNGAPFASSHKVGSNRPLKGDAYGISEGGMRMPLIARWPGKVPAGAECHELVTLMDLFPTLTLLAGGDLPAGRQIDGRDIRPLLCGESGARSPHEYFCYYYLNQLQAIRHNEWKLYLPLEKKLINFATATIEFPGELYDLRLDPGEKQNQFTDRPDIVRKLLSFAKSVRSDLGELDSPGSNVRPVGKIEHPSFRVIKN